MKAEIQKCNSTQSFMFYRSVLRILRRDFKLSFNFLAQSIEQNSFPVKIRQHENQALHRIHTKTLCGDVNLQLKLNTDFANVCVYLLQESTSSI